MNPIPVNVVPAFGLVIVNVNVLVPPTRIGSGAKFLLMEGGATTVMDALAVLPVPPFVEATLPVTLFFSPPVAPVTVTLNAHVPFAAIDTPVREIVSGAATFNVPPH